MYFSITLLIQIHLRLNSYLAPNGPDHQRSVEKKANSTSKHKYRESENRHHFPAYWPAAKASTGKVLVMPARLLN